MENNNQEKANPNSQIPDPFNDAVKELQKQENDIKQKIEHINGRLESLPADSAKRKRMQTQVDRAEAALESLINEVTELKIEDLKDELKKLEEGIKDPDSLETPPPNNGGGGGGGGAGGAGGSGGSGGAAGILSLFKIPTVSHARHEVQVQSRDYIVVRDNNTVWVWSPFKQMWDAKLETGDDIEKLEKVDGAIVVYTSSHLWLFHPLEYRWVGKLDVKVEEVTAFSIGIPVVVKKEEKEKKEDSK